MDESFHDRLAQELAARPEPPLGDLVTGALRQGRRLRLVRRARIAAATLVTVAVLAFGVVLAGHALGPARVPTAQAHLTVIPAPPTVPTTPAAIAYHLRQLLPGRVLTHLSHLGGSEPLNLEFYLLTPHGPGRVYLTIAHASLGGRCMRDTGMTSSCSVSPGGMFTDVIRIPDNCIQDMSVEVDHGNGTVVQVDVSRCLDWNGTTNPPGHPALTEQQAIAIAADPGWGTRMDASLVRAANARYPSLAVP